MRYCLSIRQPDTILADVDEIFCEYKDRNGLYAKIEKFPDKTFILNIPNESVNWDMVEGFSGQVNFKVSLERLKKFNIEECQKRNIKYFWSYPAITHEDFINLCNLNVSDILVAGELFFDLPTLIKRHSNLRTVANFCTSNHIPHRNGIFGTYIRPEDVPIYEPYIKTLEFYSRDLVKEARLFKIYAQNKQWPGNLNLLLTNLNYDVDNRVIPKEFAERRIKCQQKCMRDSACRFCETVFKYVNTLDKAIQEGWKPEPMDDY